MCCLCVSHSHGTLSGQRVKIGLELYFLPFACSAPSVAVHSHSALGGALRGSAPVAPWAGLFVQP